MNQNTNPDLLTPRYRPPAWLVTASVVGIVIGLVGLAAGFVASPRDTWLWLVIHFLVFSGIATGMLAWAAAFRIAQARWTSAINRLGHSTLAFAPFLFVALTVLLAGLASWAPWVTHPVHGKTAWLNTRFMTCREIALFAGLWVLYFLIVKWSLIADARARRGADITGQDHSRLNALAVGAVAVFAIASTIVSYDFIMALAPEWVSTMFGPYYFCTNLQAALAAYILMAGFLRKPLGVEGLTKPQQFKDIGNLMLAFSLFNMGLFFAQYLTIWYGNLPEETHFLILRYSHGPWPNLGWTAFALAYGLPFVVMQSRFVKEHYQLSGPVAIIAILGFALERYVLVVPSIHPIRTMLHPAGGLAVFAFLGAFVLATTWFLSRYSPISAADEALKQIPREETF